MPNANPNCPKCKGAGRFKKKDGSVSICFDCLRGGFMDQHDKNPKTAEDFRIKL